MSISLHAFKKAIAFAFICVPALAACQSAGYLPHRLLVKFTPGTSAHVAKSALQRVNAKIESELPHIGVKVVSLPVNSDEKVVAELLSKRPEVEFAEMDQLMKPAQAPPNDPYLGNEWYINKIAALNAWTYSTGTGVVVAILDSGCDSTHPDLAGHYVAGWNFFDNNSDTDDVQGHGTAVAGCAAAIGNNGIGIAGVAWNSRIMPLRISDLTGYASWSTAATAITWASDHGARVANLSYNASTSSSVQAAAQYMMQRGGVTTVSSGNDTFFETAPDNPYVLTVGATTSTDSLATWSNTGNNLDLVAPGVGIYTTTTSGGYGSWSGTSFSAPITAGTAALVIAANPSLSGSQVQQIIKETVDDLGSPGWDTSFGWGRVNASRAVSRALNGSGDISAPKVAFSQPADGITLQGTFTIVAQASDNVGVTSLTISIDGTQVASSTNGNCSYSWDTTTAVNGSHVLVATARDAASNTGTSTITVYTQNEGDTIPPGITITSPTGGVVSGTVSVTVDATDNVGVTKVELYVDGKLKNNSTTAPFTTTWNSRPARPGTHTLQTKAYDAANNSSWSQVVTVTK